MEYLAQAHLAQIGGSLVAWVAQEVPFWKNLATLASALEVGILRQNKKSINKREKMYRELNYLQK